MGRIQKTIDANEAVAHVAYHINEVIAIYPITPSSAMGEWADAWSAAKKPNIWGTVPSVVEMQSEGGAIGAIHGALQTGSLATTFTASQGLLLMIPNMYKIAGELTPAVFHVAARSIAAQGLSIFGDHGDIMAARSTGFGMLASASGQEAMDFALIVQAASLESRIPFLHFFDGFRTSHEISKIEMLNAEDMRAMIDEKLIEAHRDRALSPDRPILRGTSQNPDVYFQGRESVNPFYQACPGIVQKAMDRFAKLTGRGYRIFEYVGAPDAERVVVAMGSGLETLETVSDFLNLRNEKTGVLKVRLWRPFEVKHFLQVLPASVKKIAVLDRCKEPGAAGEPLYLDIVNAFHEGRQQGWWVGQGASPVVIGGRYGLSSKEFTPSMAKSVFDHLKQPQPQNHFTVGILDDVTHTSLPMGTSFALPDEGVFEALFYGLGSDGTVGANKNTIKIIGENTSNYAQAYFVYDSKKAGAVTVSHLRFGPKPIRAPYLIEKARFVGCHQWNFLEKMDVLEALEPGGVFLVNCPYPAEELWGHLPRVVQEQLIEKKPKLYAIDAYEVAKKCGMGSHTNTIMQVCFFAISGVMPQEEALEGIRAAIKKTYSSKGEDVVQTNLRAVDHTLEYLKEVKIPEMATSMKQLRPALVGEASDFVKIVLGAMASGKGDQLAVSQVSYDGTYPTGTARYEKRNLAHEIPVWEQEICIECGKCAMVCPHSVIRVKAYEPAVLKTAPLLFKSKDAREPAWKGLKYTIQVAPEDCTGCGICVDICPARNKTETKLKAINMRPQLPLVEHEKVNWEFFLDIPEMDRRKIDTTKIRQQQVQEPLFEFSSACAGCGETPYLKLLSQLFGDRTVIANATGCSSIYGGNLPTTPWAANKDGRGPAWANSLFEDNAEFGFGMRVSLDKQREYAGELLGHLSAQLGPSLGHEILTAPQRSEADIYEQRQRVEVLKRKLIEMNNPEAGKLLRLADHFVKKSVWIIGGDGWAYDIGYGGLDHVLASGRNVKVLVLDTEVYSNTGGQMSKATPLGAVAKFASGGKTTGKKDLGLMAMTYGHVYVAKVAMGANDEHTLKAFLEADAYEGPSLIIAYSHCVAHGINMTTAMQNQKAAVNSGQWALYRFHPDKAAAGQNPFTLDSRAPSIAVEQYMMMENRFKMLTKSDPEKSKVLFKTAAENVTLRRRLYEYLAQGTLKPDDIAAGGKV